MAEAYGSQFWFTRRGAIAENFCEMAREVEIEERIDSVSRWGERARYRDSETILSSCLDGDQFLEFWTRLQESIHGVRPWYESSQDSPGGLLLRALDDDTEAANARVGVDVTITRRTSKRSTPTSTGTIFKR